MITSWDYYINRSFLTRQIGYQYYRVAVSFEGKLVLPIVALGSVTKHGLLELMADIILFLNMSLVSVKCLFKFWVFNKGVMENEIAVIAMQWRIFRKNVPTSNAE